MLFFQQRTQGGLAETATCVLGMRCSTSLPLPTAVLFFSLKTEGVLDRGSLHGSCPTTSGQKFAATKW